MTKVRFSRRQLAEFSRSLHLGCELRIAALLIDSFPAAGRMPRDQLDAWVHQRCEKADQYGLVSERAAALFVVVSWLNGDDFDSQSQAIRDGLNDPQRSCSDKIALLGRYLETAPSNSDTPEIDHAQLEKH